MGIREKLQSGIRRRFGFLFPFFEKEGLGEILSIFSKAS